MFRCQTTRFLRIPIMFVGIEVLYYNEEYFNLNTIVLLYLYRQELNNFSQHDRADPNTVNCWVPINSLLFSNYVFLPKSRFSKRRSLFRNVASVSFRNVGVVSSKLNYNRPPSDVFRVSFECRPLLTETEKLLRQQFSLIAFFLSMTTRFLGPFNRHHF